MLPSIYIFPATRGVTIDALLGKMAEFVSKALKLRQNMTKAHANNPKSACISSSNNSVKAPLCLFTAVRSKYRDFKGM